MNKNIPSLSVFFPAYNEEANLKTTVDSAVSVLKKIADRWEILIVNDGSGDKTEEVGRELVRKDKRIRLITHKLNKGYGEALKTGFANAKYPWVAFTDSDGQFDFEEIKKFLPHIKDSDFILGYRLSRADPLIRSIGTWVWNIAAKVFLSLPARDYSCGFKLIKKEAYERTLPLTLGEKVTQIEMLVRAKRLGFNFKEVGVCHFPRKFGQQTGANLGVVVRSFLDLVRLWWKLLHKREFLLFLIILGVAAFLRLYKIDGYMTFLGDEGRDVIVVRRLLVNFDPILIGPGTSIGNMYLGPLYYYMMAPAMFLSGLSPVGPAVQIAILGVVTVWLVWRIGKEWFPSAASGQVPIAGLVAASLYAVSPIVITYSHSSWNPNIMPFFALLSIYSIWRVWRNREWGWLIVLGVSYAFVLQSHYLGLLLLPTIGLFWLITTVSVWNSPQKLLAIRYSLFALALFALLMSPLVIFDARHGWRNFQAIYTFFANRQETLSLRPWNAIPEMWPIWQENFITRFIGGMNEIVGSVVAVLLVVGGVWLAFKAFSKPLFLLLVWITVGTLGMALYKQNIYDHYFGFMFAAPFILLGAIAQQITKILMVVGIIVLVTLNLMVTPISQPPQRQFQRTEEVAKKIAEQSDSKPFNLAVLAERNYEDAYQYFLEWWEEPVRDIDPLRYHETVAEQLFVVCELPPEKCDPTHNPKAEITVFGWSKIENSWKVAGVQLYKLVHNPSGKPQ